MKSIFLASIFAFCLSFPAFADKTASFAALPDLPIAPRLVEDVNSAVRFKQTEGQIVIVAAQGPTEPSDIMAFYQTALPKAGWKQVNTNRYMRGKSVLLLDVKQVDDGVNRLSLLLRPRYRPY